MNNKSARLVLIFILGTFCCFFRPPEASAQDQDTPTGRVIGRIDGIHFDGTRYFIFGWACQQGLSDSIDVHVYSGDSPSSHQSVVMHVTAKEPNEPAVNQACQDQNGRHRFAIQLADWVLAEYHGRSIYIHGIRKAGSAPNDLLGGSGKFRFPSIPPSRIIPSVLPRPSGSYVSSNVYPRVFLTQADLDGLAKRINTKGSFSSRMFGELVKKIKGYLSGNTDWTAVYSGCDLEIYLRGFSFESKPAYGNDRSQEQLMQLMHVNPGEAPPHGAAIVASKLALYAALLKAGAVAPAGAPGADQAATLAKNILLAWANHGFRDEQGNLRTENSQYCDLDPSGKPVVTAMTRIKPMVSALTFSRGVVYSVFAQDLLQGLHALDSEEEQQLNAFHQFMYNWILSTHNDEFDVNMLWKYKDEVYNNQFASHIEALLAMARLLDDKKGFEAVLYGEDPDVPVKMSWVKLFNTIIYGVKDKPLAWITSNSSGDPAQSKPAYTTAIVAPGEINDRFRNSNPSQGFGYAMGALEHLYDTAEIMKNAGFDPYNYRGFRGQSFEMATQYYACYGRTAGFKIRVTQDNAQECPDYQEYIGKIVNDVEKPVLIGAYRFPDNAAISQVEAAAKAEALKDPLEPLRFGKWKD